MKQALEPLLYKHGVDVIFTGWVFSQPTVSHPKCGGPHGAGSADTVVTPLLLVQDHAAQAAGARALSVSTAKWLTCAVKLLAVTGEPACTCAGMCMRTSGATGCTSIRWTHAGRFTSPLAMEVRPCHFLSLACKGMLVALISL